jgi:hypothetical protein
MRAASRSVKRRSILEVVGVCAITALGCGSDDEKPATVGASAAAEEGGATEMEGGVLTPLDPTQVPGAGSGNTSMIVGLFDGDEVEDPSCVDQYVGVRAQPPVIEFIVDTSGSMTWVAGTERLPDAGESSKWAITRDALALAISNMPDAAAVGLSYYPNTGGGSASCYDPEVAAPIARLTSAHRELIDRVNSAQRPQGGTPTHAAYEFGIEQLAASSLPGARFLVLITDGIPTFTLDCGGDGQTRVDGAPLIASVGEVYRDDGVRTFVIGSPGSEPARDELSQMALVGGTGEPGCESSPAGTCHFDMTAESDFSAALNQALGDITEATLGCNYEVPEPPRGRGRINLDDVTVVVESAGVAVSEFERSTGSDCTSGWQYNADRTSIELCRSSCDELTRLTNEDPEISVRVKFGCSIIPT